MAKNTAWSDYEYSEAEPRLSQFLDTYVEHFRTYWVQADPARSGVGRKTFRTSSLGYCPRRQLYERAGVPESRVIDLKTQRTFQWGDDIAYFVERRFEAMGLLLAKEVLLEDEELHLSGHLDLLVGGQVQTELPPGTEPDSKWATYLEALRMRTQDWLNADFGGAMPITATEVKSQHSFAMKRRMSEGPQESHMLQQAGIKLLGQLHPEALIGQDVESWQVLCVGKDAVGYLTFEVTPYYEGMVKGRIEKLNEWWDNREEAPCTCLEGMGGNEWKYCRYLDEMEGRCCTGLEESYQELRDAAQG